MKNRSVFPLLFLLLGLIYKYHAYPTELTSGSGCNKALTVGSTYMGVKSVSSTDNSVTVMRGFEVLSNGTAYIPGETLSVNIATLSNCDYLLETAGGALFEGGSCSGTRVANGAGSLVMPQSGGADVDVFMGYASQKGAVSITPAFTLVPVTDAPVNAPTLLPSIEPSPVPSTTAKPSRKSSPQPQYNPSPSPSAAPVSAAPTALGDTNKPTAKPTHKPTSAPQYSPSAAPSPAPSTAPSAQPSATPTNPPTAAPSLTVETMVVYTVSQTLVNIDEDALSESGNVVAEITTALMVSLTADLTAPDNVAISTWHESGISKISHSSSSRRSRSSDSSGISYSSSGSNVLDHKRAKEIAIQRMRSSSVLLKAQRTAEAKTVEQVLDNIDTIVPTTVILYTVQYILETTSYLSVEELTSAFDTAVYSKQYTNSVTSALQQSSNPVVSNISSSTVNDVSAADVTYVNSAPPSWQPSNVPGSSDDAFHAPLKTKLGVGIVFGSIGLCSFVGGALFFMSVDRTPQMVLVLKQRLSWGSNIGCCVLSLVALILVAAWATNGANSNSKYQYLGKPEWGSNPLAWHPVLMVSGFFVAQTLLLNSSGWDTTWNDKTEFMFWATLSLYGFVTMVIALSAVSKYISENDNASLTTMHSWIGVMAVMLFLVTSIWGMVENYSSRLVRSYIMTRLYRALKLSTYGVSIFAIVTGVVNYLPYGTCNYVLSYYPPGGGGTVDVDPAQNYEYLPDACKLANGLAIVVSLMGILAALSLSIREELAFDNNGGRQHSRLALDDSKYLFSVNLDDYDD